MIKGIKVLVIGATGLTGGHLLRQLLRDGRFSNITIFVRSPTNIASPRLKEIITDFHDISSLNKEITGDILFNAIGTTIKKSGSKEEQQRIDSDIPIAFSKAAAANGVKVMVNISSMGASPKGNFYLRTKARMEEGTKEAFAPGKVINIRPGLLTGKREEFRIAERAATFFMKLINPFLVGKVSKYRSISAEEVAKIMIKEAMDNLN